MLAMLGMAVFASFATYWPYNLAPSLKHYTMGLVDAEVGDGVRQQPAARGRHRVLRHDRRLRRRLHAREDARPRRAAAGRAAAGDAADGGAGPRPRPRLHLLLQRARQPAARPVPDDDAAGGLHDRPLLHDRPPDRGDGAEVARRRVRGGERVAEGAVLQDLLARHPADLHADAGRHRALLLHQRDDDDLGGRLPLLARDQGRVDRDPQPRRGRRGRRRGGVRGADHGRLDAS